MDDRPYQDWLVSIQRRRVRPLHELTHGAEPCLEWELSSWRFAGGVLLFRRSMMGAPPPPEQAHGPTEVRVQPWPLRLLDRSPEAVPRAGPLFVLSMDEEGLVETRRAHPERFLPRHVRSLRHLCAGIVVEDTLPDRSPPTCRVVQRLQRRGVRAAVLRVTDNEGNSPQELRIAMYEQGIWTSVGSAALAVHNGHGMRGTLELRSLEVRQVIPGGPHELDVRTERWQGEPAEGCVDIVRGVGEEHRAVCAQIEGVWSCADRQVASGAPRSWQPRAATCAAPPWAPPPPWRIELHFTHDELRVHGISGEPPPWTAQWSGRRSLLDFFLADSP